MNNILNFNVENFKFERLLDEGTALLKIKVCSSGMNAHRLPFTEETLRNAAEKSLRGKPLVGAVQWDGDLGGHERPEYSNIIGYVVENQDFEYIKNDDGTTGLYCYAILWKIYAPYEYECILNGENHIKGVSMEIKWNDKKFGWEDESDIEQITDFVFKAICILGDKHIPASKGANAQMIKFSEKVKETEMKYFESSDIKINNSKESAINKSGSWSSPGRKLYGKILKSRNKKSLLKEAYLIVEDGYEDAPSTHLKYPHHSIVNGELVVNVQGLEAAFSRASQQHILSGEVKAHLLKHYRELGLDITNFTEKEDNVELENNIDEKEKELDVNTSDVNADVQDNAETENVSCETNDEKEKSFETENVDEKVEDEKEDVEQENTETKSEVDYEAKCAEYEAKIAEMEDSNKVMMEELEELRKYKSEKEEDEKNFKVSSLFEEVMDVLPKENYNALKEEAKELKNENFEAFSNKVKALCFSIASKNNKEVKQDRMAIAIDDETKTEKKFW